MRGARKWIVSRFAETRFGRASLVKAFGGDGAELISILEAATAKITDDTKQTDKIYGDTVKILTKVGLLWTEKGISPDMVGHLRDPGKDIAEEVGNLLRKAKMADSAANRAAAASSGGVVTTSTSGASAAAAASSSASAAATEDTTSDIDISSLVSQCEAWKNLSVPLLHGKIRDRNLAIVESLGNFYTSKHTLEAFFTRKDLAPERTRMMPLVDEALRRTGGTAFTDRPRCVMAGCELPRAAIPGTDYCIAHHAIRFSSPVTLQDFLDNQTYRLVYSAYLDDYRPHLRPLVSFLERCARITSASNKGVLRDRAKAIVRRFVASDAEDRLFFLESAAAEEASVAASSATPSAAATAEPAPSLTFGWGGGDSLPLEFQTTDEPEPAAEAAAAAAAALPDDDETGDTVPFRQAATEPMPMLLADSRYSQIGGRDAVALPDRIAKAAAHTERAATDTSLTVRADTFSGLTLTCLGILDRDFVESFTQSPQFAAWASDNLGVPLPRISFKRLRSLISKGVTVSAVTGGHVRLVSEDVAIAVTAIGAGAVGVDVGVPINLASGVALEGSEARDALLTAESILPAAVWRDMQIAISPKRTSSLTLGDAAASASVSTRVSTSGPDAGADASPDEAPLKSRMRVVTDTSLDGDDDALGNLAMRGGVAGGAVTPWSPATPAEGLSRRAVSSPAAVED